LKETLVQHLICPKCRKKFVLKSHKKNKIEIFTGILICKNNHKFPIKNGIPRLVVDKAGNFVKTEDAFSAKWKKYNKVFHGKKWYERQKKWF